MSHETINLEESKPRSYAAFIEKTGLNPGKTALDSFTEELQEYRIKKANKNNITLEELHSSLNQQEN